MHSLGGSSISLVQNADAVPVTQCRHFTQLKILLDRRHEHVTKRYDKLQ